MHIRTVSELKKIVDSLTRIEQGIEVQIKVCAGTGCRVAGAFEVYDALIEQARLQKLPVEISFDSCLDNKSNAVIGLTGCQGMCQGGPLVSVGEKLYLEARPTDAARILAVAFNNNNIPAMELGSADSKTPVLKSSIPFYRHQTPVVLSHCGDLYPQSIRSYLLAKGFAALEKCFSLSPSDVIFEIEKSGLRGRGGGGFPTGRKWRACSESDARGRYIVCNGDEGDPGAFMDCALMEGNPFLVIEGLIIGGYAIGAKQGFIYVRNEYPVAVQRLQHAINECLKVGLLGENILQSGYDFSVQIIRGGGAFVCGESSALMRSIEGKVGEPNSKYIRSTEKGLFEQPTVLNNVETLATVPYIVQHGSDKFRSIGTKKSPGTKAFCLAGAIKNTGLIEVPMGISLRDVIFKLGGGMPEGRSFKAVQTGGPSGGCLSESQLDLPVDFDVLYNAGSMMGSGGMIILDERSCIVDFAKFFTQFLLGESCGKCVPCREGLVQLHIMLTAVTKGVATLRTLDEIEKLATEISKSALCGLGKSASNPVISALQNFREEFVVHIEKKRCQAGVCTKLTTFVIDSYICTGCMRCKKSCPVNAIEGEMRLPHTIDENVCIRCGACRLACPEDAVAVQM